MREVVRVYWHPAKGPIYKDTGEMVPKDLCDGIKEIRDTSVRSGLWTVTYRYFVEEEEEALPPPRLGRP